MEPLEAWEAFLERVVEEDEMLYAVLVDLGFVGRDDDKIRLAAPSGCMARQQLAEDEMRARCDELLLRYLGHGLELSFVDAAASLDEAPSVAQLQRQRREEHQAQLETEARTHPAVRALLAEFGGNIRSVEPTDQPPA